MGVTFLVQGSMYGMTKVVSPICFGKTAAEFQVLYVFPSILTKQLEKHVIPAFLIGTFGTVGQVHGIHAVLCCCTMIEVLLS
jgi:hypothetical protein